MKTVLNVYKPVGATPYDIVKRIKTLQRFSNHKIGYAGRLDPMAEGVLLLLIDEENKKRKEYERLKKMYEVEILFGIETDTYDVLGLITSTTLQYKIEKNLQDILTTFTGKQIQPYPPYSSARVNGRPLFYWAREQKIDDIEIPKKEINIYRFDILQEEYMDNKNLQQYIFKKLETVHGNFRQEEIKKQWNNLFNTNPSFRLLKIRCVVECSSGTYIRSLASRLGKKLGTGGIALSIKRTAVGDFSINQSLRL